MWLLDGLRLDILTLGCADRLPFYQSLKGATMSAALFRGIKGRKSRADAVKWKHDKFEELEKRWHKKAKVMRNWQVVAR